MTTATTKPTGICPVCRRGFTLTKTGKVWPHRNGRTDIVDPQRGQRCQGSGDRPA